MAANKRLSSLPAFFQTSAELPADGTDSSRGRLRKAVPSPSHSRAASGQLPQPTLPELQGDDATMSPLMPPPVLGGGRTYSRSSSMASLTDQSRPETPVNYSSRPGTPTILLPGQHAPSAPSSPNANAMLTKEQRKKSSTWFGKGKKDKNEEALPVAWIAGHPNKLPYDTDGLLNGRPMQELWDETQGNCYIYLFPRNNASGKGASFKVDSAIFAASPVLTRLAFGDLYSEKKQHAPQLPPLDVRTQNLSLHDPSTPPESPKSSMKSHGYDNTSSNSSHDTRGRLSEETTNSEAHLYLPVKLQANGATPTQTPPRHKDGGPVKDLAMEDLQSLIDIRNFFAFLCGQSLVATTKRRDFFSIFMVIAGILRTYEFSNVDGSTFGEVASSSFDNYVEELALADVRSSREKTIECIVLGERMRSVLLYNEAFTHGAGKHDDISRMQSPKFSLLSPVTDNRLVKAAMDLDKRTASVRLILSAFEFPALFTGIMNSKTSEERKEGVRFDVWKDGFLNTRKWLMGTYKQRYGDWPPKASSKKNELETSGLNRLVLRDVYHDMSALYDLLVDRHSLTSRTVDGVDLEAPKEEPTVRAIRAVLSEYDRSSPPVKPPVPFDLPLLPRIKTIKPDFGHDKKADIKLLQKKVKDVDLDKLLTAAYNPLDRGANPRVSPFVQQFKEMERRASHGCTISEILDQRIGTWIFMYVVLQALPMLAVDAPGLKFTHGVEYFLCEPPRSGVPWANANAANSAAFGSARTWFSIGESGGVVSLPADVVEHGVEGIYHRSHCWNRAEEWTRQHPIMNEALHEQEAGAGNSAAANVAAKAAAEEFGNPAPLATGFLTPEGGSRPSSRAGHNKRHSSLGLGLEALPLPVGVTPDGSVPSGYPPRAATPDGGYSRSPVRSPARSPALGPSGRPKSMMPAAAYEVDTSKTFDSILGGMSQPEGKKGGKKK